jgi:uncharacterized protein YkvS
VRLRAEEEAGAVRRRAEAELQAVDAAVHERIETRRALDAELTAARAELVDVTTTAELQGVGLFDYDHPAESSAELASRLEALRYTIKNAVRDTRAVTATSGFTFNGSEAQGRRFVSDMSKVLLRAYNAEAENAVKATKAGNLHVARNRLTKAAEQIARSGTMIDLRIQDRYHELRLEELQLASAHLRVLQAEKEMERERRAELREQAKASAELQAEHDRLDKERALCRDAGGAGEQGRRRGRGANAGSHRGRRPRARGERTMQKYRDAIERKRREAGGDGDPR